MNAAEQDRCFELRALAALNLARLMPRDQDLLGASLTQHVDPNQVWRHDHGVNAIHVDRLHGMQVLDWLAVFSREADVAAEIPRGTTRFQPAHHVAMSQMLVLETYRRVRKDPAILQHP